MKDLFKAIKDVLGIEEDQLKSSSRKTELVEARVIFSVLAKTKGLNDRKIAELIGRERTAPIHMRKSHEDWVSIDPMYRDKFFSVEEIYLKSPVFYVIDTSNKYNIKMLDYSDSLESANEKAFEISRIAPSRRIVIMKPV